MSLTPEASHWMSRRDELNVEEKQVIDSAFKELYFIAGVLDVPTDNTDGAAILEAAMVKYIIESRKP